MKGSNFTPRSNKIYGSTHSASFKLCSVFKQNLWFQTQCFIQTLLGVQTKSVVSNTIPHSNFIPHSSPQIIYNLTWPTGSMKGSNFTPRLNKVASSNTFLIQTSLSLQTQSLVPNTFPHSNFTPRSNFTRRSNPGARSRIPRSNFNRRSKLNVPVQTFSPKSVP